MDLKTLAFLCILCFNILTTECSSVLKTGEISGFANVSERHSPLTRETCEHSCVCEHGASHLGSCTCGHCPCGGDCHNCVCCGCGIRYSGLVKRDVCEACGCTCGPEWTPNVPGKRRCRKCGKDCFPGTARVSLENGKSVMMSELQVGDRVQTVSSDGSITHSQVRTFMKKQDTVTTTYKSIKTVGNNTITLTGNHLLHARKSCTERFSVMYVDQVSIGDEVLAVENDHLIATKVINASSLIMRGAYIPVTMDGNIIVDGILASCYASANHNLVHLAIAPL